MGWGPLNNNNSGTGVYTIVTLIIDVVCVCGGGRTNKETKNYICRHRTCNKYSNTKGYTKEKERRGEREKETDRQAGRQTDNQTERQTARQGETKRD